MLLDSDDSRVDRTVHEAFTRTAWEWSAALAQLQHPPSVMEAVLRAEPFVALRNVTSEMSDRDLIGAVTTFTDFSDDDFRGIRDVRTYVNRLAAVALAGVWTPAIDAEAPLDPLAFYARRDAESPSKVFGTDAYRIHAVFPTPENPPERIMVKWYREDEPELMQLSLRSVDSSKDRIRVSHRQRDGWAEGRYRVEIYSTDEGVERIVDGSFDVMNLQP